MMMRGVLVCCVLAVMAFANAEEYVYSEYLNPDKTFQLAWSTNNDSITVTVTVDTLGWVAIGFSPNGNMQGSDMLIGWVTKDGTKLQDRFADQRGLPRLDASQDWTLISGSEANGQTVIKATRKLRTCDKDDREITAETMRVIWAFGKTDPAGDDPYYHRMSRGVKSLGLVKNGNSRLSLEPDVFSWNLTMDKLQIPSATTTYSCRAFELPATITTKHHIVGIEGLVQPGHEGLIHHVLLYSCSNDAYMTNIMKRQIQYPSCFSDPKLKYCKNVIAGWAIGNDGLFYPKVAGLSIGTPNDPRFYVMQVHYDNPAQRSDFVDSSGFRLSVTPTPRQHDIGVFMAGDASGLIVPPGQKNYHALGYCSKECTQKYLPSEGVTMITSFLHSHLLGKQIYLYQKRDGKVVNTINQDNFYDFNFQKTDVIKPTRLMPGDEVEVSCRYDSTGRTRVTYGGEPTDSEMCLTFVSYYPKASLGDCGSRSSWYYKDANGLPVTVLDSRDDYDRRLNAFDWQNQTVFDKFQDFTMKTNHILYCFNAFDALDTNYNSYTPGNVVMNPPPQPDLCAPGN